MVEDEHIRFIWKTLPSITPRHRANSEYQIQLNELEAALLDQKVKVDELQKENGQLKRENTSSSGCRSLSRWSWISWRMARSISASRAITRNT